MSKTWWSPLAVSCKPEPHSSIVLAFEPLQIAEVQTCCIICSKEDPLYASSHWNTQLDRASLPNQSGVHWFCSWLEEMVPWVQKPLLPDFFLTNDRLSLRFENLPVTFSGGLRGDNTGLHSFTALRRHRSLNGIRQSIDSPYFRGWSFAGWWIDSRENLSKPLRLTRQCQCVCKWAGSDAVALWCEWRGASYKTFRQWSTFDSGPTYKFWKPTLFCLFQFHWLGAGIGLPKVLPPFIASDSTGCAEHSSGETGQAWSLPSAGPALGGEGSNGKCETQRWILGG